MAGKLTFKDDGLPEGYGLFWTTRGVKQYIYAKFEGQGLSCSTTDWREAVDFVEKLRDESKKRETGTVADDVLVGELLDDLISYYEGLARKRGDYKPKIAYIAASQINMKGGIRETFGKLKVSKLRSDMYPAYRTKWETIYSKKGKSMDKVQYTIDHHLRYLRRAIIIGQKGNPIKAGANVPKPHIDNNNSRNNVREGLIDGPTFTAVLSSLTRLCQTCIRMLLRDRLSQKGIHIHSSYRGRFSRAYDKAPTTPDQSRENQTVRYFERFGRSSWNGKNGLDENIPKLSTCFISTANN